MEHERNDNAKKDDHAEEMESAISFNGKDDEVW